MYARFSSEPNPKQLKPNFVEERKTSPSSNWQQDPRAITDLPEAQQCPVPKYRHHWHQIRALGMVKLPPVFSPTSGACKPS